MPVRWFASLCDGERAAISGGRIGLTGMAWVASARLELRAQVVEAAHSQRDRLACAGLAARALRVAARHGQGRHLPAADARQAQAKHRQRAQHPDAKAG